MECQGGRMMLLWRGQEEEMFPEKGWLGMLLDEGKQRVVQESPLDLITVIMCEPQGSC